MHTSAKGCEHPPAIAGDQRHAQTAYNRDMIIAQPGAGCARCRRLLAARSSAISGQVRQLPERHIPGEHGFAGQKSEVSSCNCHFQCVCSWPYSMPCLCHSGLQEHEQRTNGVLAALLKPIPEDVLHVIRSCTPAGPAPAAEAAEPASNAAGQPAQPPRPAGPPPAHPLAAVHQSMPQWPAVEQLPSLAALRAASMPALPSHVQRPAGGPALPAGSGAGSGSRAGADVPLPLGTAPAPAGLPTAGPPAQLSATAAAGPAGTSAPVSYSLLSASAAAHAAALLPPPAAAIPAPHVPSAPNAHLPGRGAAAAVPRSPAASPPPSVLQQPPAVLAAAGGAGTPSTDLSSHTIAAGPRDASPTTSGGSGLSSPSKRKRGADQVGVRSGG